MHRASILYFFLMPFAVASAQTTPTESQQLQVANAACANISLGLNGALNGFVPSPNDPWHQDISAAPVAALSNTMMLTNTADLAGGHLHPDFGTGAGIPYNVVDSLAQGSQYPPTPVSITLYPSDSDLTAYPLGAGLTIEGNPGSCPTDGNDRHMIVIDRRSCTNYEMYQAASCNGSWSASEALLFDWLSPQQQRPFGMTSADASGLSVFEGLIRYDEILAGSINHAIRFTTNQTRNDNNGGYFVYPATHAAGSLWGTDNVMGERIRLKADFDISGFSPTNQIILTAMKKYGLILTDNGSKLYFQGTTDSRWNDADLGNLQRVVSADFEVVQYQVTAQYDAADAPTGAAPVISNFVATPQVYYGTTYYILSANVAGGTYSYLNVAGQSTGSVFRGYIGVQPTATTTYTLTSRNQYGTTQAKLTITP